MLSRGITEAPRFGSWRQVSLITSRWCPTRRTFGGGNTLSFAWQNEDNITTLEMLAALAEIRCRARQLGTQRTRFFHVLDSQVVYHIMAKGRAHSKRLNRLARRMMAVQLGGQLQALALWTISAWNFADTVSRRFAPHHGS